MATENYGAFAQLIQSVGSTPVSTDTVLIFIGASAGGELNKPVLITSMSEYNSILDGTAGDGYNLTEAAIAAFQVAGINRCYMIPVSHAATFTAADYVGSAANETGVHAVEKLLRESPTAVNILCAPSISDGSVIAELLSVAKLAAGHWRSFVVCDMAESIDHIDESGYADVSEIVDDKAVNDEFAAVVWGHVKTSGGYIISGAAVRACLVAKSDANYGVPARCGGNLTIPSMQAVVLKDIYGNNIESDTKDSISAGSSKIPIIIDGEPVKYDDSKSYELVDVTCSTGELANTALIKSSSRIGEEIVDGLLCLSFDELSSAVTNAVVTYKETDNYTVNLKESAATQLSADGICSYINYGGGNWHTWGDHTSAFAGGTISDELGRFDNTIRMNIMITNRFQLKYRFEIDNPMTLQMRNDVINEELDYLNSLVSIGALIGEPSVEFRAVDNGNDQVSQGYFTWTTLDTPTIPSKYMLDKVAYTQAGLSVYLQAA